MATTQGFLIRPADADDLDQIIRLDAAMTSHPKPDYWTALLADCRSHPGERLFLAAAEGGRLLGFIAGEIRAWEFGSPPCGWVFAIAIDSRMRLQGVGAGLFEALCERFRAAGVGKVRTMVARDAQLVMSFFRAQGMMAGPFIELEKDLRE